MEDSVRLFMNIEAQRAAMEALYASIRQAADADLMAKDWCQLNKLAVQQAEDGNRQARSAEQLTKIATAIVMCTLITSIVSVSGAFCRG